MRRIALSAFLLPLWGWGQAPANALLWKLEGHGLKQPSYVLGTVHSKDARAFGQVPQWLEVLRGQEAMAGELDLATAGSDAMQLMQRMMLPPGKELADLYSAGKLKRVKKALAEHLGPLAVMGGRMKPFFLVGLLSEAAMHADSSMVLDQYLQEQARTMGKEVLGIETPAEQLAAVDALPLKEQADMLYDLVKNDLHGQDMDRLLNAYAAQDISALAELTSKEEMPQAVSERLLKERNAVMAQRMDSLMQGGRTFFFAIGAAHLPKEDGVLDLLRERGYSAVPVKKQVPVGDMVKP